MLPAGSAVTSFISGQNLIS